VAAGIASAAVMFHVAPEVRIGVASEAAREATAEAARGRAVHAALQVCRPHGAEAVVVEVGEVPVVVVVAAEVAVVVAVGGNQHDFEEKHGFTIN
jgi:hypothetical protein